MNFTVKAMHGKRTHQAAQSGVSQQPRRSHKELHRYCVARVSVTNQTNDEAVAQQQDLLN
jgi:hypothetical protein